MLASRPNSNYRSWRAGLALITLILAAGCAGHSVKPPNAPNESVLAPAEQALAKARDADADTFAPRVVDASRRRIATARDILYSAARRNRPLNETEQERVDQLVAAAELDARSALVQTQAKAVKVKLAELQQQLGGPASNAGRATSSEVSP